jgi:hypothetical protein
MASDQSHDLDLQLERAKSVAEAALARMHAAIDAARRCKSRYDAPGGLSHHEDYEAQFAELVEEWRKAEEGHREAIAVIHELHERILNRCR